MSKILYVVVPCYNEEEVLPETSSRLSVKLGKLIETGRIDPESRILFVNDGSKDKTWSLIEGLYQTNPLVCGLCLSRNKGHQNALLSGLMAAIPLCDFAISIDADLQDDIEVFDQFIDQYDAGKEVVYGVRSSRKTDSFFKRGTAQFFYKFMKTMGVDIIYNHADYRLMSKRALQGLSEFKEVNLFLRGIVPLIGYESSSVFYERSPRFAGESKYPLKKMLAFAFDGITSFSVKPIRMISSLGFFVFLCSLAALIYGLVSHFTGRSEAGWTSLIASIWMIGGVQLLCLGVIGEYIGKIYQEVKARPHYIIKDFLQK